MPDLIVRKLESEVVEALKKRAAAHGRSTEMEHREILREVLLKPRKLSFIEALASIPNVGTDADFERVQSESEPPDVFT